MTIHPLPPQAYTKDTLIKAYHWLQSQGESIKQIATSPDVLVSLYMKAQMQGEEVLHRPSIRNFKHDLKNLASLMGDWESEGSSSSQHIGVSQSTVSIQSEVKSSEYHIRSEPKVVSARSGSESSYPWSSTFLPNNVTNQTQSKEKEESPLSSPQGLSTQSINASLSSDRPASHSPIEKQRTDAKVSTHLDEKSRVYIEEVQLLYNLSSPDEALRLLISMGYHRAKSLMS